MNRRARRSPIPRFESNGSQQPCRVAPLAASSARPISPGSPSYRARCRRSMTSCEGSGDRSPLQAVNHPARFLEAQLGSIGDQPCKGSSLPRSRPQCILQSVGEVRARRIWSIIPASSVKSDKIGHAELAGIWTERLTQSVGAGRRFGAPCGWLYSGSLDEPTGLRGMSGSPPAVPRPRHRRSVTPLSLARNRTGGLSRVLVRAVSAWYQEKHQLAPRRRRGFAPLSLLRQTGTPGRSHPVGGFSFQELTPVARGRESRNCSISLERHLTALEEIFTGSGKRRSASNGKLKIGRARSAPRLPRGEEKRPSGILRVQCFPNIPGYSLGE